MQRADELQRRFRVDRDGRTIIYPFTCFADVFTKADLLSLYLRSLIQYGCPNAANRISVTTQKPFMVKAEQVPQELCQYAAAANYKGTQRFQHDVVQRYLLENDPHTVAVEVPVWDDEYSGHIDILRRYEDKIQVWDFKPEAHKEKWAGCQVKRYIMLLSKRLKLPLSAFEGYYFDDKWAYFLT